MNLFDLFVKIGVQDEVSGKLPGIADKLKSGLALAGKAAAVGIGAATTAMTALTKSAVDGYAETEQLRGGVETLFKTSADTVKAYADNAYKTAGMSANEYMNTVTSFSASLLQSLGGDTEEAAEYANRAVVSMSDNANKMGTDISMIQNAYQGFAKQNYTMLDNLKLGYGGTQKEMERLIKDASEMTDVQKKLGITVDGSSMSFSNIVNAIEVMQESMGIAGATYDEASGTIQGSLTAMKSAWTNLVAGLADENADLGALTDNLIESVEVAGQNILPVVDRIIDNMLDVLTEKGPDIAAGGAKLLGKIAAGAIEAIPVIISSIPDIVDAIVEGFKESDIDMVQIGIDIVKGIWQGISSLGSWLGGKVSGFFDGLFDGVKEHEDIHSPSKKWAFIGKNDALGVGAGWDEAFPGVKKRMEAGLDFDTATIDAGASALSGAAGSAGISVAPQTIVVQLPNGDALASFMVDILRGEARLA